MIGIIAGEGVQIGVLLDANAPVSVMIDPLLKVVNVRLRELGLPALEAKQRGRWALCLVDGTPLRATQSLTEQDIYDGDRLWLRFVDDTEHRSQVIEHISTAVSVNLSKRFSVDQPRGGHPGRRGDGRDRSAVGDRCCWAGSAGSTTPGSRRLTPRSSRCWCSRSRC